MFVVVFWGVVGVVVVVVVLERVCVSEQGRWAKGERENLRQAPCSARSPIRASVQQCWDHDLSSNQESDIPQTEPPRNL